MKNQSLRNLTTGRLHTNLSEIYEAFTFLTGEPGIMTHMLPNAYEAIQPWLHQQNLPERFWDCQYDPTHTGETEIQPMSDEERTAFFQRFAALPSPLFGAEE